MELKLVSYEKKYYSEILLLLKKTWEFHKLFPTMDKKNHELVYKASLDLFLNESNYRKIAVNEKDEVLGYLLGKDNEVKSKSLNLYKDNFYYFIMGVLGKFGDRKEFIEVMKSVEEITDKVIPNLQDFDSEIKLFIVSEKSRGLGLGKLLMDSYLNDYCEKKNYKKVVLFTDEACTYSFYDKYGFERYKEAKVSKNLSCILGENAFSYVYEI